MSQRLLRPGQGEVLVRGEDRETVVSTGQAERLALAGDVGIGESFEFPDGVDVAFFG